jgi:serine/threonine-protein kinase
MERISASDKGVTYKAHNNLARRFEILKVLPAELQSDGKGMEHMLREARVHSRLNHPNIAAFYTAIEMEGRLVICSEFVRGMTVESRRKVGAIPIKLAVDYVRQVLAGLDHAHKNGVVHRNLSPSNMIITDNGVVKLSGFDLAKGASDPNLTVPGSVVGSVDYISPEQIMGSGTIDGRADIYGMGAVLYELLTQRKMFPQASKFGVMTDHVQTIPEPPSKLRAEISAELDQAVLKAVAKEPPQRFQTAGEMSAALEAGLSGKIAAAPEVAVGSRPARGRAGQAGWRVSNSQACWSRQAVSAAMAAREVASLRSRRPRGRGSGVGMIPKLAFMGWKRLVGVWT